MQQAATQPLLDFTQHLSRYMPTLVAGLVVLALGIAVGWIAKRAVVSILVWLRLDRLGGRVGWRAAFAKGDVRAALYEVVGSVVMGIVILVFLDNALEIWGLNVLSRMIDSLVVYIPNLGLVAVIAGVGVLVANVVGGWVEETLAEEEFPRARLVTKLLKGLLLTLVGALALWQLNFARQLVLAAFLIGFGSLGVAFALGVGLGTARAIQRGIESLFQKDRED